MNQEKVIREYLRKLCSKGGKDRAAKHDHKTFSKWAKLGGRPRKERQP
jgi:hypothetical protein